MKRNIFLLALLCLQLSICAQSPGFYIYYPDNDQAHGPFTMPTNAIADDFGPRNLGDGFHGGVDFNCYQGAGDAQKWRPCVSPQAGIIPDFDKMSEGANGYKYGLLNVEGSHTLLFGHLFDNGGPAYNLYNSSIVFGKCLGINDDKWGFLLDFTDSAGNPLTICYGQVAGATFRVGTPPNHKDYITTNVVNTTDPFYPIGNSPDYIAHLHLNTLPYNTEISSDAINGDPTQFLNIDRPLYDITVKTQTNANQFKFEYPGTNTTKVSVRTQMRGEPLSVNRYSKLMDMNKVELQLKNLNSGNFERVIGDERDAIISEGGRLGEMVLNHKNPVDKSDWSTNGVHSNAYNGAASGNNAKNPWDEYYFIDFKTRIHIKDTKNDKTKIADLPNKCRYNDDNYQFRVKTTTASNSNHFSAIQNIDLDNFKPYISFFDVKTNGSPLYQLNRKGSEGVEEEMNDGTVSNESSKYALKIVPVGPNSLSIEITTSEPMQNLQFAHKKETQTTFSPPAPMIPNGSNKLKWSGNISTTFTDGECFNIQFFGQDLSTNQILGIHKNTNKNKAGVSVKIPTRKGDGPDDWNNKPTNSGMDQIDFCIEGCTKRLLSDNTGNRNSSDCDALSEVSSSINYISCKNAEITLAGTGFVPDNFDITWTDGSGITLPQYQNHAQITVTNSGTYCYKIEAVNDCCEMEGCVEVLAEELLEQDFIVNYLQDTKCTEQTTLIWDVNGRPSDQSFKFEWSDGTYGSVHTVKQYGTYNVTITDNLSGCVHVEEFEFWDVGFTLEGTKTNPNCSEGGKIDLAVIQKDESLLLKYIWSDGSKEEDRENLAPGQYCVTVTNGFSANDDPSNIQGCKKTLCFTIIDPPFKVYQFIDQKNCSGLPTSISVFAVHNTNLLDKNFEIRWDDGVTSWERTVNTSGQHCYSVIHVPSGTCKKGCINVESTQHIEVKTIAAPICTQGTGKASASITGGTSPYTYKWSTGATTQSIAGLNSGTYIVTVSDRNNCTHSSSADIQLINLIVNIGHDENPQTSCTHHTIMPQYSISSPINIGFPLNYKWSTGATTSTLYIQSSGNYCVTATSSNLCTNSKCFDISLEPTMTISTSGNTNCPNPPGNGVINVNASGGKPPYKYSYHPGPQNTSNSSLSGLSPGSYHVVVSDVNGCKTSKYVQIEHSNGLNITVEKNDACAGSNTGQVKIKLPFVNDYRMNLYKVDQNGNRILYETQGSSTNTFTINNLPIGMYFVEVLDVDYCDYGYKSFEIKQSNSKPITDILAETKCIFKTLNGSIKISDVKGGTPTYNYIWSSGTTGATFNTTIPGLYTVTVSDANTCSMIKSFEVKKSESELFAKFEVKNNDGCDNKVNELVLKITISTGNPPFKLNLDGKIYDFNEFTKEFKFKQPEYWANSSINCQLTDQCGFKTSFSKSFECLDFCSDKCLNIIKTGKQSCTDFWDDTPVNINPDEFEIVCNCNDNQIREVIPIGGSSTLSGKFQGKTKLNGITEVKIHFPGRYDWEIVNHTTGCRRFVSITLPKKCLSFWDLSDIFTGGGPGGSTDTGDDSFKCPELFTINPNPTNKGGTQVLEFTLENDIKSLQVLYKDENGNVKATISKGKLKKGEHSISLKTPTQAGVFTVEIIIPDCNTITKKVILLGGSPNEICGNKNSFIQYDHNLSQYVVSTFDKDSIYAYLYNKQNFFQHIKSIVMIQETEPNFVSAKNDVLVFDSLSNQVYQISSINIDGAKQWEQNLTNIKVFDVEIHDDNSYSLLTKNIENHLFEKNNYGNTGSLLDSEPIELDHINLRLLRKKNEMLVAQYDGVNTNEILYKDLNFVSYIKLPKEINIKDIEILDKDNILIGFDFLGSFKLNNAEYNSDGYINVGFVLLNKSGEIKKTKIIQNHRSEILKSFAPKNNSELAFIGKYYEEFINIYNGLTIIDSCTFIEIIELEDVICSSFTSTLTALREPCQLTWNAPPAGYTTELQWNENGIWIEVSSIGLVAPGYTSPFTVLKDGTYRLIHKKVGCPDVVSNSVTTTCHGICVCPAPVLSYDNQACHITWSTEACPGYTSRLQRQNANGGWDDIALTAASPYTVTAAGIYRVLLTKPGCSQVLSNVVTTTACSPSTNPCTCTNASQLTLNTAACSLSWNTPSCSGYTSILQRFVAGAWTTINSTSPYAIPANNNGQYRVLTSKPGCGDLVSNIVSASCSCSSPASITVFNSTYGLGQNVNLQKSQTYMHNVTSGHPNVCDDQFIELRFDANVVNSNWNISGTVGILPATVINGYYTFTVILPNPPSSGYGDVWLQSPCGDFYTLRLVYNCVSGCVPINVNVSGNVNNSCENLTVNATGGTAPYTYQITGTGTQSTPINQNGSSNVINLTSLQSGEAITLSITVTDANGCTGEQSVIYLRCNTGCTTGTCNSTPPVCNGLLTSTSGYNEDAIINFVVPQNVFQLTLNFDPDYFPQVYRVYHDNVNIINVPKIYRSNNPPSTCQQNGANVLNSSHLLPYELVNIGDYASKTFSVTPGDLITIDINHPACTNASAWRLRIFCSGTGSRPFEDEILMNIENVRNDIEDESLSNAFQLNDLIRFYPNPFSKGINMEFTAPQSDVMKMEVYNQVGIQVFTKTIDLMPGINLRYIDEFENMPSGVYTVKMRGTQSEHNTRVIKIE